MKKLILSLVATATISITSFAQLQSFDSGVWPPVLPNTITTPIWGGGGTSSGDPATWYRSDDPVVNGSPFGMNGLDVGYGGSGNCAILYSNQFDGYDPFFEVDMIINNIDISSYNAPGLKFYMKHPDGNEEIEIAVSSMGGPYSVLQTFTSNFTDWTLLSVDLSAFIGSPDLSIRFRGKESNPFSADMTNVGIDQIEVFEQTNMVYVSSTTTHDGCGLKQGYNDQPLMRIDVTTEGSLNPLDITELILNTNGSSDDCSDVVLKKIYSTGTSSVFNTSNLIGSSNLTGNYTVTGNITLSEGTNYFWVACDIPTTSALSNVVDAECTGLVVDGNTETPLITAPAGNLVINNTGIFEVTNLNDTGAGSLRQAIINANALGCGDAVVDASGVSGTINWGSKLNCNPNHDVSIIGPGADQLIISGTSDAFLYHYGDGSLIINNLKVTNFSVGVSGTGVIYKPDGGDFIIENCDVDGNSKQFLYFPNDDGNVIIRNCTFSNNSNAGQSGVMYCPTDGSVSFYNSTFYNNYSGDYAGVMYTTTPSLTLENCTFKDNSCIGVEGNILFLGSGTCTAINTTFDNNTPNDFSGQINMNYSHMSNTSGATITGLNNILNVTANLSVLANYGGTTPTCSINPGSPLINAGIANIEYDQRGYCRPNVSDIGAYEYNGIQDVTAPIPDVANLPDLVYCPLSMVTTLIEPTATDNCASTVMVTHDACLPITASGTTVVTWTYDDGNENTSTQTQNVVINDITAPVADVALLADVTAECEVTALTAPTATDNCGGAVIVTNDAVLPITTQGTTVVTWTYDDGNENTSTQTQNIILETVDINVTQLESLLTADATGVFYQWLDCDNGNAYINGETNQSYAPAGTGNYAVELTLNGCAADTSACYLVDYTGLDDLSSLNLLVYPNPSNDGYFNVQFEGTISAILVYDMLGRIIAAPFNVEEGTLDASSLEAGKYSISIHSNKGVFIEQMVIVK